MTGRRAQVRPRTLGGWALGGLLVLLPGVASGSNPPEMGLAQLGIERWGTESGLAGSWVRDLVQGPDGFLWIATSGGLSRFDGRSFVNFTAANTTALPTNSVAALALGARGRLWIGLEHGGIRRLEAGRIRMEPGPGRLPPDLTVNDLLEDASGILWVATTNGLWRVSDDSAERVAPSPDGLVAEIRSLVRSGEGEVWVRTLGHGIWRLGAAGPESIPEPPECPGHGLAVGSGDVIFRSCPKGLLQWDRSRGRWLEVPSDKGLEGPLLLDRYGSLWFGGRAGLHRRREGVQETLPPREGLEDWRVRAFLEDENGDLWVGTFSGGLTRLQRGAVRAFGGREALPVDETRAVVARPDGDLWIAGNRRGLVRWSPTLGVVGRWTHREALPGETVLALALDPRRPEGVWVGTDAGLVWLERGVVRASGPTGVRYDGVSRLVLVDTARADRVWVAGWSGGALELSPDGRIVHDGSRGLDLDRVRFLHRERGGTLLAGGDAGLFRQEHERWRRIDAGPNPLQALTAIAEESDGTLWLASSVAGLVRRSTHGEVTLYGVNQGLPFLPIHSLELDGSGGLWLSGHEGLARLRLDDHARWRRGELGVVPFQRLHRRDGLRDAECNGWGSPASTRLPNGALVYPTIAGIAVVDPTLLPAVELAAGRIYLDAAWAGTRSLPLDGPLHLLDHERSLRIRFSIVEFVRPEAVSFRYRLDGIDDGWVPAGAAAEAAYARLTPGEFLFRVQARLPGREWVESARSLRVVVEPRVGEATWFRATVSGLLLALGFGAYRWRIGLERRHAAALRTERSFLREVIDLSPNPIFVKRRDGTYSLANRAAARLYGLAPQDLEGRSPGELGPGLPGMDKVEALDAEVLASGAERHLPEEEILDHEGRPHWFRVVKRPAVGLDGRAVEQVMGTAVDVTDYKRAELETRRLSLRLLRAQEDERRTLAGEIHDDFTQRLAGLAMQAWSILQALAKDGGVDARKSLRDLAGELERIANDIQGLSRELHPRALESLGLAEALKQQCSTFARRTGLAVTFESSGRLEEPKREVSLALYRITQEALRNCLTHSGSGAAAVRLVASETEVRLEVADAGAGFDAVEALRSPGLGVSGMMERARLAGGALELDTAPGRGTCIRVRLPVGPGRDDQSVTV